MGLRSSNHDHGVMRRKGCSQRDGVVLVVEESVGFLGLGKG